MDNHAVQSHPQPVSRRHLVGGAVAAAVGPFVILRPGWAATGPVKLGMVEVTSGTNKFLGDARVAAAQFAADRVNAKGGIRGRKIEIVVADSALKPDLAIRRANELLRGEKVDFITGFGDAPAKAVAQAANEQGKIFIGAHVLPFEMTGSEFLPTTFNCALNYEMLARSAAIHVKQSGRKSIILFNPDNAGGHSASDAFRTHFGRIRNPDQRIVAEEYHPAFKIMDFAPYVSRIMASGADTLITADYGSDLRLLVQQGSELGWKLKVVGFYLNSPEFARAVGPALVGHVTTGVNMISYDSPTNRSLIQEWRRKYPDAPLSWKFPDLAVGMAASAFEWLFDVAQRSPSFELADLIKTWEGDSFETPWGPAEMRRCDHQMISNCCVAEIMAPASIPAALRFHDFPYIGPARTVDRNLIAVPPGETGNRRCT